MREKKPKFVRTTVNLYEPVAMLSDRLTAHQGTLSAVLNSAVVLYASVTADEREAASEAVQALLLGVASDAERDRVLGILRRARERVRPEKDRKAGGVA